MSLGDSQKVSHWLGCLIRRFSNQAFLFQKKADRIDSLRQSEQSNSNLYNIYLRLFEEFSTFNSDSAYSYAKKLYSTALLLGDAGSERLLCN